MTDNSHKNWQAMSDKALSETIGSFIKHHRLIQNKTQNTLAKAAGLSRSTLSLLERGENVALSSLLQVLRVLDLLYILEAFKVSNEISPIAYAKLQQKERKRANNNQDTDNQVNEDIGW
jgi:transcriptional regulator with XRE-family HTH domain